MELPINQDPEKLNKSVYAGWRWWQYALIVFAIIASILLVLLFQDKLGITVCSIISIFIIAIPGRIATFRKNGMNFFDYRKKKKVNQSEVFVYVNLPCIKTKTSAVDESPKKGITYILKNLITGGKNL